MNRSYDETLDGRRWSDHHPEFATFCKFVMISSAELDILELGVRTAQRYAQEAVDWLNAGWWTSTRVLHPVERVGAAR